MSLKVKATLFLLLCLVLPALSKNIYIKYEPTCMDRYEYRLNGNTTGGGLIAYYLKGPSGKKIMLEVGVESIKRVKVAPKGTQSCKWVTVNEKLSQDINAERHQVFIVRKTGSVYTVSPVHLATYFQTKPNDGVYVSGNAYNFEYQNQASGYTPNDLAGSYSTSKFIYTGASDIYCERAYTIKEIPIETCKPTTDLRIIPGIGIIEERKDVAPFSTEQNILVLTRINGQSLQDYLSRKCNPAPKEVITYQAPAPPPPPPTTTTTTTIITTPAEYEVVYQEVPVEHQPVGAEMLFQHKSPPPVVEKFIPEAPCPQASTEEIHIVQRQETLFGIARKYNLNVQQLRDWNKLDGQSTIFPCMKLKILPIPTEAEVITFKRPEVRCTQVSSPGIHVIQPEETLARVANIYGISVANLRAWNNLGASDLIKPCAVLVVTAPKKGCAQQSYSGVHIVQAKENITEIARLYGISIDNIRQWNQLNKEDIIRTCTALKIAAPLVAKAPIVDCPQIATPGIHIVQAKQSVTEIARIYGISVDNIRQWNKLKRGDVIRTCAALKVVAPAINCTQVSSPGIHIVQAGETLQQIAERYWISVDELRKWNKLSNNSTLRACVALKVAEENVTCKEASSLGVHIVQYQENLTEIARTYGVSIEDIRQWNNIDNKHLIRVCSSLKVAPPRLDCDRKSSRGVHIIREKETLLMIAHAYNISIIDLKRWNNIGKSDIIKTCTALIVAPNQPASYDAVVAAPCAERSYAGVHIVQARETLIDISEQYFVSVNDLRKWNKLGASDIIRACTALKVVAPQQAPQVVAKSVNPCSQRSYSGVHIIQPRETLNQIAERYFVSVDDIRRWNKLGKSDIIHACTALKVIAPRQNAPQVVLKTVNPCSQRSSAGVHVIQPKETLNQISERYFVSVDDIRRWNKLGKSDLIYACTALKIIAPQQARPQVITKSVRPCSQRSSLGVHVIQPRETLNQIAARYFVSVDDIRRWNKLGKSDIIHACTALRVAAPQQKPQVITQAQSPCSQQSRAGVHVIQPRETLIQIAERYYISVDDIRRWNQLGKSDIIHACTALRVAEPPRPQAQTSVDKRISPCTQNSSRGIHIVQPKQTLIEIADRYFITVEDIRNWNKLGASDIIRACTALKVAPPQQAPTQYQSKEAATACAERSSLGRHIVQPRETLTDIAERYFISVKELRQWNNLGTSDLIQPCMAIRVSPITTAPSSSIVESYSNQSTSGIHVVQPKETLSAIAKRYAVSVEDLRKWNNLGDSDIIQPYSSLKVTDPKDIMTAKSVGAYSPQSTSGIHVVHPAETLTAIAERYAVSIDDLRKWNNLGDSDIIRPSTTLIIANPKAATSRPTNPQEYSPQSIPGVHLVQATETLSAIAKRYGVSVDDLKKWNNLGNSNIILPATSLIVAKPVVEKASSRGTQSTGASSPQSTPGVHVIHPEETLSAIAKRYAVSVDDLRKWNNLGDSDIIKPSTALIVAAPTTKNAPSRATQSTGSYSPQSTQGVHVVQATETLTAIAKRYGVSVDDLRKWNNLGDSDIIKPSTALVVAAPRTNTAPSRTAKSVGSYSPQSTAGVHIVHPEETLSAIAKRYAVSVDDLRKWNNLGDSDIITPSTTLVVAASANKRAPSRTTQSTGSYSPQSTQGVHVVQATETLTAIAKRYGVSVDDLRKWNNLGDSDIIKPSTALVVAAPRTNTAPSRATQPDSYSPQVTRGVHVVHSGETLSTIAERYTVSVDDIRKWNNLGGSDIITPGTSLIVTTPPAKVTKPRTTEKSVGAYSQQSTRGVHIVHEGETLSAIAKRYAVSVDDLRKWNNLGKSDAIRIGTTLIVAPPTNQATNIQTASRAGQTASPCATKSSSGIHVIQFKETLTDIARQYFVSIDDIRKWNRLTKSDIIQPCTALKVAAPNAKCTRSSYPGVHIVQQRETLTDIARRYAVGVPQLRQWNNLGKGDVINVCSAIKVVPPKSLQAKKIDCAERSYPGVHIVQSEETLTTIANKYKISIAEIRAWNNLDKSDIIIACKPLRVAPPTASNQATVAKCKTNSYKGVHVVQPKETISSIAKQYAISVANLKLWNNLGKEEMIHPCSKLKVAPPSSKYKVDPGVSYTNSKGNDGQLAAKGGNNTGWLAGNCVHVIRAGETLTSIALLYGFTADRFRYFNNLKAGDIIRVGQQLKTSDCGCGPKEEATTSKGGVPAPYDTTTKVHVVKERETLTSIAAKYHITVKKLQGLNQLEKGEVIFPFMKLKVQ